MRVTIFCIIILLFSSCNNVTLLKRKYTKGYYWHASKGDKFIAEDGESIKPLKLKKTQKTTGKVLQNEVEKTPINIEENEDYLIPLNESTTITINKHKKENFKVVNKLGSSIKNAVSSNVKAIKNKNGIIEFFENLSIGIAILYVLILIIMLFAYLFIIYPIQTALLYLAAIILFCIVIAAIGGLFKNSMMV